MTGGGRSQVRVLANVSHLGLDKAMETPANGPQPKYNTA